MSDRNKVLVGAGIIWGITFCGLFFHRKLPKLTALFNLIPGILFWNQKMEDDEEQQCNISKASTSAPVDCQPNSHAAIEENNATGQKTPNFIDAGLTGTSPVKFISSEDITKAVNSMKNMALAHEIAMDKNFQLQMQEPDDGTLQRRLKDIMHKVFWNLLAEQLAKDPPDYKQALVLLNEIKETLDELVLPHHEKIRKNMNEVLDVDLIKQQAENGVLDFHHYAQYVISIMSKVCAPVRDEEIKELSKKTDVIEIFKGIMETLQLMRLDLANFRINMIRPNVVAFCAEYEQMKFSEFLKMGTDRSLPYTEKWLLRHFNPETIKDTSTNACTENQIAHNLLTEAYLDLLEWDFVPEAETLKLDQGRLLDLRDKTNRLSIIGSVILLASSTVGAPLHEVSNFKKNIKHHLNVLLDSVHSNKDLEAVMPNIVLQVKTDVRSTLQDVGAPEPSPELEALLEGQILELVKPDQKIRHLIMLRIRQFLQKIITQSATPQQVPPGLSSLKEELTAIAAQFLIVVSHNRSVFGDYYQEIVLKALGKNKTDNDKEEW